MTHKTLLIDGTALRQDAKGVARYTYHVCAQLDKLLPPNWKMKIVTFDWLLPHFSSDFRGEFIQVPYKTDLLLGLSYFPKIIKSLQPDIFIRPRESIGIDYSVPTVTVCHDLNELIWPYQPSRSIPRRLFDYVCQQFRIYALRRSELAICNSEFVKREAIKQYRIPTENTRIGYCGVDSRFYSMAPKVCLSDVRQRYGGEGFLLAFATGDYRENFNVLPASLADLKKRRYSGALVVAGVKDESGYAKALMNAFDEYDLIRGKDFFVEPFLGENQLERLVELYTAADFYLELSFHEGFGMQLAEAMACGTTCISSARGALAEVGAQWAIEVDPCSFKAISAAICDAWRSEEHERDNREQVQHIREKFCWDGVGDCLAEFVSHQI